MARKNREAWLNEAMKLLRAEFFGKKETRITSKLAVSCGWCSGGGIKAIGVCHPPIESSGKFTEMFIAPSIDDPILVLGTLLHEMIHAQIGCDLGHGRLFKKRMAEVGLAGKATATIVPEGSELEKTLKRMARKLGKYPHSHMRLVMRAAAPKKSLWVRLRSKRIPKFKVVANIRQIKEHGLPRDPLGEPMIREK